MFDTQPTLYQFIRTLRLLQEEGGSVFDVRRRNLRFYVWRAWMGGDKYCEAIVAGPFWRKKTALVAMKVQEALHGRVQP